MQTNEGQIQCPFCLGEIPEKARKCKHCGEWLTTDKPEAHSNKTTSDPSRTIPVTSYKSVPADEFPMFSKVVAYLAMAVNSVWFLLTLLNTKWPELDGIVVVFKLLFLGVSIWYVYILYDAIKESKLWPFGLLIAISICGGLTVSANYLGLESYEKTGLHAFYVVASWAWVVIAIIAYSSLNKYINNIDRQKSPYKSGPEENPADVVDKYRKCPNCGKSILIDNKICRYCRQVLPTMVNYKVAAVKINTKDALPPVETSLINQAHKLYASGDHHGAMALYIKATEADPDCKDAWLCIRNSAIVDQDIKDTARQQILRIEQENMA